MPIVSLRDLYMAELQDLFDAEERAIEALPSMAAAATSSELKSAFEQHLAQTQVQLQRLDLLLRKLNVSGSVVASQAIRGIVADARRRIDEVERGDVLDAALIGTAQRIEHYEIAGYGCARTYARILGDHEATRLLQQTLDEEGEADRRLSALAQAGINQSASEDVDLAPERQRERLEYLSAAGLRDFKYREFRVSNAQHEDLGRMDGLVIDRGSRRALYVVVDSGGWFVGQRYLVPVGLLEPDETGRTLRTDLNREAIRSYPPFNPDAFAELRSEGAQDAASPEHQPPTWLMTGVWMTEASGFAAVPPRAHAEPSVTTEPPEGAER